MGAGVSREEAAPDRDAPREEAAIHAGVPREDENAIRDQIDALQRDMAFVLRELREKRSWWQRLKQRVGPTFIGVCVILLAVALVVLPIVELVLPDEATVKGTVAIVSGVSAAIMLIALWRGYKHRKTVTARGDRDVGGGE